MVIYKSPMVGSGTPATEDTLSDHYTKAPLGNDLISGRIQGGALGIASMGVVGVIMRSIISKNFSSLKGKEAKIYISNLVTNVSTIAWDVYKFYFSNAYPTRPAVILASIPLGTVTEVSHAMSQRDLKFRAVGGVFLADQEGGEKSLRIVGKAWGKNRFAFLQMLDFLFMYGSKKAVDLYGDHLKTPLGMAQQVLATETPEALWGEESLPATIDPWQEFNRSSLNEGISNHRATFPVITRQKIYANMFIETYEYTESIELGIDVVEYVIFLRKYVPTPPMQFQPVNVGKKKAKVKWFYKIDTQDALYNTTKKLDVILDIGLATAMIMYRTMVYLATGKFSFMENLVSRFGIALNRSIEGTLDPDDTNTSDWTPAEEAELFGYKPCEGLSGIAYDHCMLGVDS